MKSKLITLVMAIAILVGTLLSAPSAASAHAMMTDYLLTDQFELNAVFSTGDPYPEAPVLIYAPTDESTPWLEGKTDANGHFAFMPDQSIPGDWTIRIGEGDHGDILTVPVDVNGVVFDSISSRSTQVPGQLLVMGAIAIAYVALQAVKKWIRPRPDLM